MRRALLALIVCLPLAGCDAIFSMAFPTRYSATSVMDINDGGRVTRQTVVTGCKATDQSALTLGVHTEVTGERHWIRRADGSLWVMGLLNVCRWGAKGPRGDHAFRPFRVDVPSAERDRLWSVPDNYAYRYDDPVEPTQVEMYDARQLFEGGGAGLRLSGQLAAVGDTPTDTLSGAFPFLTQVDAAADAARAKAKAKAQPSADRDYDAQPGAFTGFVATAQQLHDGACPAPDPKAEGPIRLEPSSECRYVNPCRPDLPVKRLCKTPLGGLKPTFAPGYDRVSYTLADRDLAFIKRLARTQLIEAADPPRYAPAWFEWNPKICLDGFCFEMERMSAGALLYYPRRNVIVEVHQASHSARGELFLAKEGPVWGGTD